MGAARPAVARPPSIAAATAAPAPAGNPNEPTGYNPYASLDPFAPGRPTPTPQTTTGVPPTPAPAPAARPLSPEEQARLAEEDRARLASGNQSLLNRRVYDLGRVRNRSKDYVAPGAKNDMLGARKTLLGL